MSDEAISLAQLRKDNVNDRKFLRFLTKAQKIIDGANDLAKEHDAEMKFDIGEEGLTFSIELTHKET